MTKTQRTLVGLLVVQVVAIFLVQGPLHGSTAPAEQHPLFAGLDKLQPTKLEIDGPGDEGSVTLVRSGDEWTIEQAGGYPADETKVTKLLDTLRDLQVRRPVVTSSRYHKALKVTKADYERHLEVWAGDDTDPQVDLYLGTSPNYRSTHVRVGGQDDVYEVSGLGSYDVRDTTAGWIDTRLVDVKFDDVTGVRVQNANGAFQLDRKADGSWQLTSGRALDLDKAEVDSLVRSATGINAAEPEGPLDRAAQGLDPAAATVTLWVREPPPAKEGEDAAAEKPAEAAAPATREVTIWIGAQATDKDSQRFVAYSGFPFTARAWKGSVDKLVNAKLDDLKKKKPATG